MATPQNLSTQLRFHYHFRTQGTLKSHALNKSSHWNKYRIPRKCQYRSVPVTALLLSWDELNPIERKMAFQDLQRIAGTMTKSGDTAQESNRRDHGMV